MKFVTSLCSLVVAFWIMSSFVSAANMHPNSSQTRDFMREINNQVTEDAVKQLDLSIKGGDLIEICTQASLVVAAYNQAHDEKNYLAFKKVQRTACKRAGSQL